MEDLRRLEGRRRSSSLPGWGEPEGGIVLALETSGRKGSVALGRWVGTGGTRALEVFEGDTIDAGEDQAAVLLPRVERLLLHRRLDRSALSGVVVGSGPGSFTGVRVGAATAKGLAWALGVPFWGLSSLAAAAAEMEVPEGAVRGVLFDARGDRLYAAVYRISAAGLGTLLEPCATTVGEFLARDLPPGAALAGEGARRHREALEAEGWLVLPSPAGDPSATGLLRLLGLLRGLEPVTRIDQWEPEYLRPSGAERLRGRRRAGQ